MQYLLLIYGNEAAARQASEGAMNEMIAAYARFKEDITKSGVYVGSNRLRPTSTAKTVRAKNGKLSTIDGPFAETKEQLGGYFLIDVPDLDAALSWAARCPAAHHGAVEVRPIWPT